MSAFMRERMLRSSTVSGQTSLSRWLRQEMPRRGYPLEGHRAGGITRLATDTGISQATMSRMVNGQGEPSIDSLRKIGNLWGFGLQEMMIFAGLAEPSVPISHVSQVTLTAPAPPGVQITELDANHLQVGFTIDTDTTMDDVYERLGDLSPNERAMVANMEAIGGITPAEIGGAVLLLRHFKARREEHAPRARRKA